MVQEGSFDLTPCHEPRQTRPISLEHWEANPRTRALRVKVSRRLRRSSAFGTIPKGPLDLRLIVLDPCKGVDACRDDHILAWSRGRVRYVLGIHVSRSRDGVGSGCGKIQMPTLP